MRAFLLSLMIDSVKYAFKRDNELYFDYLPLPPRNQSNIYNGQFWALHAFNFCLII